MVIMVRCNTNKNLTASYNHEIESTGVELDGSITLKTWGKGRNRADGIEQAKKEAVNAVLFTGIRNGKQEFQISPILNLPNIRESRADYFNDFFKDSGEYLNFVSNIDKSFGKIERARGRDGEFMFGFVIRVMKSDLKNKMLNDGILSKN